MINSERGQEEMTRYEFFGFLLLLLRLLENGDISGAVAAIHETLAQMSK